MRSMVIQAAQTCCVCLVLSLAACGGSDQGRPATGAGAQGEADSLAQGGTPPAPVSGHSVPTSRPLEDPEAQLGAGLAQLGPPLALLAQLDAGRGARFTPAEGYRDGADYASLLPNNRVSVDGLALAFDPSFGPGGRFSDLAYAIWDFTLPDPPSGLLANFTWGLDPSLADFYIGVGNFEQNRWDWHIPTELVSLTLTSAEPYISTSDRLLLVLAVTGTQDARLDRIQLAGVSPPAPDLVADIISGLIPFLVDFDGSGSSDPDGSIVSYKWDFDGDGSFGEPGAEAANADNPDPAPVTYASAGSFEAALRVTDNDGASAEASLTITANSAPSVQLTADPLAGVEPLEVVFTANASDANGSIVTIEWDFDGDATFNEPGAEQAASGDSTPLPYTYNSRGSFDAGVRVFDNQGAAAGDSVAILVGGPPQVDLSADVTSGPKPLTVTFTADASDPGGSIADVEWDFDGDSVYNESTNGEEAARGDPTPAPHTYTTTAERDAHVRVTDNETGTDVDTLHISITNTPPEAALGADTQEGDAALEVSFDGSGSTDPGGSVVNYEWDFDGNNVYGEPGAEDSAEGDPTPQMFIYMDPGVYTPHLRVTDDDGAIDVDTLDILAHGWLVHTIDSQESSYEGKDINLILQDGRPLIAHGTQGPNSLRLARSSTPEGRELADWSAGEVLDGTLKPARASLALVGGNPAVCFFADTGTDNQGLYYARATNSSGMTADEWTAPVPVDLVNIAGVGNQLLVVDGKPSIAYNEQYYGDLKYARSTQDDGSSGWSSLTVDGDFDGPVHFSEYLAMAIVAGNPAIVYTNFTFDPSTPLFYVRSATASGSLAGDWTGGVQGTIYALAGPNARPSLAVVNGKPAVSFMDMNENLLYARSGSADGSGSWLESDVDAAGGAAVYSSLALISGFPAIAYYDDFSERARYASSADADGDGGWDTGADIQGSGSNGRYIALIELATGRAACAFLHDGYDTMQYAVHY